MKKPVSVTQLKETLDRLIEIGYGDAEVWYRPYDSMDEPVEEGLWDTYEDKDGTKYIFLA